MWYVLDVVLCWIARQLPMGNLQAWLIKKILWVRKKY